MKIVILGAGNTGSYVASIFTQQQHDITLIDRDPKVLDQINRETDVATVLASMPNLQALANVIERKPDLFFAATNSDETNLISCSLAKNLGIPKTVARIKSPSLLQSSALDIRRLFYADHFIGAEMFSARDLFKRLIHSGDLAFEHFAYGAVLMRTIVIPPKWKKGEIPIKDLNLPSGLIAGLIRRGKQILFPHGNDVILPGDEATLIGEAKIMDELHEHFHIPERRVKSVILVGGTEEALLLAQLLLRQRVSVRILEKDPARCKELSDLLPQATILNRIETDPSFLSEESVKTADALVCCTKSDGANFLIASMATYLGCPKSIALVGDPAYIPLFEQAKIIPALSARINVANRLSAILHEKTVLSVGSISNDAAKIVELKVSPSSGLIGIPLSDLHLPKDLLIAVIENHGKVMIGRGSSILCPDDTVIAICSAPCLEQHHNLFQ
jgi:trk system potassium uptake protein TrkA